MRAEVAVPQVYVGLHSDSSGLSLRTVGHWPGGTGARVTDVRTDPEFLFAKPWQWSRSGRVAPLLPLRLMPWPARRSRVAGLTLEPGPVAVCVGLDGRPQRLTPEDWIFIPSIGHYDTREWTAPLPGWEVGDIPHWLAPTLLALPPVLWLAVRGRRFHLRRRRRRTGLCMRCGYDLTGNASGRCSECGEEVGVLQTNGRVTP